MSDRISLTGLSATGYHGVFDSERRDGQTFIADVVIELDTRPAAASDSVSDTVDYSQIATRVVDHLEGTPVNLIETLAENIANDILGTYLVTAVDVTIHKPQAPLETVFADVSVSIRRERA
jgi:dihydroneopterin aldolase